MHSTSQHQSTQLMGRWLGEAGLKAQQTLYSISRLILGSAGLVQSGPVCDTAAGVVWGP